MVRPNSIELKCRIQKMSKMQIAAMQKRAGKRINRMNWQLKRIDRAIQVVRWCCRWPTGAGLLSVSSPGAFGNFDFLIIGFERTQLRLQLSYNQLQMRPAKQTRRLHPHQPLRRLDPAHCPNHLTTSTAHQLVDIFDCVTSNTMSLIHRWGYNYFWILNS